MEKVKEKLTTIKLEVLFIIVLLAIVIIAGLAIFTMATKNKNIDNFKDDAKSILSVAKNIYPALEKSGNQNYIITSEDGSTRSVCITITGLEENDYLTKEYKDWSGYIVVEKQSDNYTYTLWGTNKKYVLNGYNLEEIKNATTSKEITKYNNEEFEREVTSSYEGKSGKKYNSSCISKKVE
jgi:hypothetical protein